MSDNTLFLVSGASGTGKTTIMRSILENEIISFSTRQKRIHEIDGVDYNFITVDQFMHYYNNNGLIEYTQYADNYYGITKEELLGKLEKGSAFAIVDVHGMEQLNKLYHKCVSIFVYSEYNDIKSRMESRGDSKELINKRLSTYEHEMNNKKYYDYVIRNKQDNLNKTIQIVKSIIEAEI